MKAHIIYISIMALVIVAFFYAWDRGNKSIAASKAKDSVIEEKNSIIQYHTNELGHVIAQKNAAEATSKEIAKAYPLIVDQLKKEFDVKIKDMRAYIMTEFAAHGQGVSTINNHYYIDSTGVKHSSWELRASDGYLDFSANIIDSTKAPWHYNYGDTATTVFHAKKKWLMGSEKMYSSTMLKNPNAKVIGTTNILVDNYKDKRWVISAGISYMPLMYKESLQYQLQPSIHIGYALFKF